MSEGKDGGVVKSLLVEGKGYKTPADGSQVQGKYRIWNFDVYYFFCQFATKL